MRPVLGYLPHVTNSRVERDRDVLGKVFAGERNKLR